VSTFEKSSLIFEVSEIVNDGFDAPAWYHDAKLIVGSKYFDVYKVISIDILRDYAISFADKVVIEVAVPGGTFIRDILPYKEDLKLQLITHPLSTQFGRPKDEEIVTKTYRATLIQTESPDTASSNPLVKAETDSLNLMSIRRISLQLQDVLMEQLRLVSLGTVVRQATPEQIVKGLVTQGSRMINVDQENALKGITMIEADNEEIQTHVIVPHGTKLTEIPDFIQNTVCGIYSSGLGFYLQNSMWYIWPLYNFERFDTTSRTLTVILVPENKFNSIEKTYRTTANQVIVLITGGAHHVDDTEEKLLNEGNGIRFADSRRLIEGFGKVKGNRVSASRSENGSEFVGIERASKLHHVSKMNSSNNIYREASRLAARKGSRMMVNWQNSDPNLLSPAMGCQVIFERDGVPITLKATLTGSHTYVSTAESSVSSKRHLTNTVLSLFVDKDLPELKDYVKGSVIDQYSQPL
jgi:hypothetical protein